MLCMDSSDTDGSDGDDDGDVEDAVYEWRYMFRPETTLFSEVLNDETDETDETNAANATVDTILEGIVGWLTNHWVLTGVRSANQERDVVFCEMGFLGDDAEAVAQRAQRRRMTRTGLDEEQERIRAAEMSIVDGVGDV